MPTSNLSSIPEHRRHGLGQFPEYFETQKPFPAPTYFCKGNHEDFELLAKYSVQREVLPNLFYIPNGEVLEIQRVRVAFLGGNFSPKWFGQGIPLRVQNQKILGYLRKREIETILQSSQKIDILVTHEPSFGPQFSGDRQYGCQVIHDLIESLQPRYAFSGHIHKYAEGTVRNTRCIALGATHYKDRSFYELFL